MARSSASTRLTPSTVDSFWPHQNETIAFFANRNVGFDFSDPGTGKTRSHIEIYRRRRGRGRLLVVCPKTLMYSAWGADIERFAPELTVSFATAEQREQAFAYPTDVVIINTDGVKDLIDSKGKPRMALLAGFDELIVDESTAYKHPTSKRSKAIARIRKVFKRRRLLSGTPNPNSVMELWHQTLLVDDGKRLGTSYTNMRNIMQAPTQIGPSSDHLRWDDKPAATHAVNDLLKDITIRHAFESVMTHVPPNHRDVKQFLLSKKAQQAYDRMERDCLLAFEQDVISAVHAASLRSKLLQIASGAVYNGNEEGAYTVIDPARYELIAEIVESRKHSVVFFNWRHQRDLLAKEFAKRDVSFALIDGSVPQIERDKIVQAYQAGKYQTILLHPRTGAHGLTLTRGDTTIVSSPIYEADLLKQGIHRIYRGEQNQVTNTILIEAKNTVEGGVYARLNAKEAQMDDLLSLIQRRRR